MKQKSFVALIAAFALCFAFSTAAFAIDDDISAAVVFDPSNVSVNVIFKTINPSTKVESAISGEIVGVNTATSVLEMALVPQSKVAYNAAQYAISYDPAFFAIAEIGEEDEAESVTIKAKNISIETFDQPGSERKIFQVCAAKSSAITCDSGADLVKVYLAPQKSIPVVELKDHIALVAVNNDLGETVFDVKNCQTFVENTETKTQYIMSLTYFPSSVTANYDGTKLTKKATLSEIKKTISLSNTYNVSGEAVTDFTLYTNEACTSALSDGGLSVGSNTLWVKTPFGGKTFVVVTAQESGFIDELGELAENDTYKMTEDVDVSGMDIVLTDGKTLDLNGWTLKAKSLTLTGGAVIGGEGQFYGTLNTETVVNPSELGSNGGWMPIKNAGGYYTFADVSGKSIETGKEEIFKEGVVPVGEAKQMAGIFTLNNFFREEMATLVNDLNEYRFTIAVTITTNEGNVAFQQVNDDGSKVGDLDEKAVQGDKVTFEMELNDAIKAALDADKTVKNVYAVLKKTGDLPISGLTYQVTVRNNLFAKTSGIYTLGKAGFNWLGWN